MKLRILLNLIVSVVLLALTAEYNERHLGIVDTLETQSYDWRLTRGIADEGRKRDDIVIVDIDRDSFRAFGRWPWTRDRFADLTEQLFEKYEARMVGFVVPFPAPNDAEARILDKVEKELMRGAAFSGVDFTTDFNRLRADFNYDDRFADAMRDRPVILGNVFGDEGRTQGALPESIRLISAADKSAIPSSVLQEASRGWAFHRGYTGSLPALLFAAGGIGGHLQTTIDDDGVVRRVPLFVKHAGGYYASLPVVALHFAQYADAASPVAADVEENLNPLGPGYNLPRIKIGRYSAPLNADGRAYLRYLGPGGRNVDFETTKSAVFRYLPVSEVAAGETRFELLNDKIVLVGSSSSVLRDLHTTPVNPAMPGVELAATQLANLLDGDILHRPANAAVSETVLLFLLLMVLSVVFAFIGPLPSLLIVAPAMAGYGWWVLYEWDEHNEVFSMAPPLLATAGLYIFHVLSGFVYEWQQNRRLQNTFSQYVPPEFAKKMGQSGERINLEGEERELTLLFSDVRNFTALAEKMSPRELTLWMNRMLTAITESVHRYSGTVDKYIGDAVMAFWNAPLTDEAHAKNAVLAALDMQKQIAALSEKFVAGGLQPVTIGVGVCTGDANVGNMGSTLRMAYTAVGDAVNLASRTEGLTKHYKVPVLVAESTRGQCGRDILFRSVDTVRVKGREQPVVLYEPLGLSHLIPPETIKRLKTFETMRKAYLQGDFAAAKTQLDEYLAAAPDDGLAQFYAARLADLAARPRPENWDGVTVHETK